jgi:hypothetical protein
VVARSYTLIPQGFQETKKKDKYMAKNMTRKGLAFGAGIALVASGFAAVPASANGVDNGLVTLIPSSGTQYDQLQALTLDLTGAFANAAASGGNLKFLVTDADKVFKADVDINGTTVDVVSGISDIAAAAGSFTAVAIAANKTTVTFTGTHTYKVGDRVTLAGFVAFDGTAAVTADSAKINTTHTVTAVSTTATFTVELATALTAATTSITDDAGTVTFVKSAETGNATRAEIAAADLGSRSILGTTATISARAANGSFVVDTKDTAAAGSDNVLRLVSTAAADTSATATVTAWIDNNGDNLIQSTEYVSPTRTVRFLKNADVTFTTALTTPVLGGTSITSTVSISNVNMAQIPNGTVTVAYTKDGASYQSLTADAADYSADDLVLVSTQGSLPAHGAGVYGAQASYAGATRGDASFATTNSAAVDVSSVSNPAAAPSASVSGSSVKTGTTSVSVSSTVKKWVSYGPGVEGAIEAGVPAVVTITKVTLAAGSTVTAGGKTLASTGTSISFDTVTNADGKVVVDLSATGTKGTSVSINVKVADENTATDDGAVSTGTTGGFKTSGADLTLTWADPTIASIDLATALGFGGEWGIVRGSTNTLSYDIRDNFGAPSAVAGTYRVNLAVGTVTGGASWTGSAPVTAGKASFTFTDNTVSATGVYTVTATLEKLNTAGTAYDATGTSTTTIVRVAPKAAATVTATAKAEAGLTIDAENFVTQDFRLDANSDTFPYTQTGFQVTGVVRDSTGAPIAGVPVVVASEGVAFAAPQSTNFTTYTDAVVTVGSATVYTNASGQYSVTAWSHKAGTNTFTVTSGAATTTTSQTWAFATTVNKDTKIVISAPASVSPASIAKGSVTLTDKWGNIIKGAIAITFTQTGPGYIVSTPTAVSAATGSADFVLFTGANDSGTAVITVKHDSGTVATTDDVSASASIVVGANAGAVSTWTSKIDADSAKIYAKNIVGAGKVQFFLNGKEIAWVRATSAADSKLRTANGASYLVRTVEFAAGKNVLEVYVDGVRTTRTAYTK